MIPRFDTIRPRLAQFAAALVVLLFASGTPKAGDTPDDGVSPAARTAVGGMSACAKPGLTGTFFQPLSRHLNWDLRRWAELETALRTLGMTEIFVQWSSADGIAFYPKAGQPGPFLTPLDRLFDIAARRDIGVWVGLELDKSFLNALAQPAENLTALLAAREKRLARMLPDLAAYLRRQESMAGWYISAELYDGAWTASPAGDAVRRHLARLAAMLKRAIDRPVAISAFANGGLTPGQFAAFWETAAPEAGIDLLLFQDGVGAAKLSPAEAARYARELALAMQGQDRQFGVIVEQFEAAPADSDGPAFRPAPIGRVRQQLDAIAALPDIRRIAFTLPDYILADSGPGGLMQGLLSDRSDCD